MTTFADNRRARHDYETLETFDGGLVLSGQEVKSVREGGANLTASYLSFDRGELYLVGANIAPYRKASRLEKYDPSSRRKVLMRKSELQSIVGKTEQKGLTLVPFSLYARGRQIKLKFGLCRGKKAHEKRDKLKRRVLDKEIREHL